MEKFCKEIQKINQMRKVCGLEEVREERVIRDEMSKKTKKDRLFSLLAHLIAVQSVSIENITYEEAAGILERAEYILKSQMKNGRATIPGEARDKWGTVIE